VDAVWREALSNEYDIDQICVGISVAQKDQNPRGYQDPAGIWTELRRKPHFKTISVKRIYIGLQHHEETDETGQRDRNA